MKKSIAILLWALCAALGLGSLPARAQDEDIAANVRKLSPAQEQQQRDILAQPVPSGATPADLAKHFTAKDAAAILLAEPLLRESVMQEAVRWMPTNAIFVNNLAGVLAARGEFAQVKALRAQALAAAANPFVQAQMMAIHANDPYLQYKNTEALQAVDAANQRITDLTPTAAQDWQKLLLHRGSTRAALVQSAVYFRQGKYTQAAVAAEAAEQHARKALAATGKNTPPLTVLFIHNEIAQALARKISVYRQSGRFDDAEKGLAQYLRLAREVQLPADYVSGIYATASNLRFAQREFAMAEKLARQADAALDKIGQDPLSANRVDRTVNIYMALAAQKKWPEALQTIQAQDSLAGDDAKLKARVLQRAYRATVYFGNERFAQAAPLYERTAQLNRATFGEGHFFVAQYAGMQGAALWRMGTADSKAKAVPLLKAAVRDYMAPSNADYLESNGIRKELRDYIFAAYLDAVTTTPGEDPAQAMGPADWVRTSSVQDALADAAVRAAASTPALTAIVRQEQDAKNEINGLRRYLSGEAGDASSPLPAIAQQMRQRIAELQTQRTRLQSDIKAQFPDYERLVRPTAPSVQSIAQQLNADQALVLLLPTQDAVYVWAVASDRPSQFVRAPISQTQLADTVAKLRAQLDFNQMPRGRPGRYDSESAFALYDTLLAPLAPVWKGKSQLIIAAGGVLSQLPFSVLHTAPGGGAGSATGASAPWLVAHTAITQVPSLSAWIAIKSIAKSRSANEAFIGWGDPVFNLQATAPAAVVAPTTADAPIARSVALNRAATVLDIETTNTQSTLPAALRYGDMAALPDTRDELLAIAKTLSADMQRDVIVGARATRESVLTASLNGLLARKRVVAFATHGLMAGDLPSLTQPALALAFSSSHASAGPLAPLLLLEDVLTLKLNADWVVLSACNTAAADGKAEEALSGLARGFFYAGSRSLLVTHWAVESESATLLTTATFDHYTKNPQAPKAESLRQAMLKVMAIPKYNHPAFWAPYALVGDGGR
jgi:CHAT domain-containing protein